MKYNEIQNEIKWELLFEKYLIVLLEHKKEFGPESNLLTFNSENLEHIKTFEPPVKSENQWDGFINVWIRNGKPFVGSWSGFEFEIDLINSELKNKKFTK